MRTFVAILAVVAGVAVCSASADLQHARIITVDDDGPADFATIQAAIDDANAGDTIIVADGTYTGAGNRGIEFSGKAITVRSENGPENCIIDCQTADRGFSFRSGEEPNSVLAGLTITNGRGPLDLIRGSYLEDIGGGVYVWSSSPTIRDCVIKGNSATLGGGIICCEGSAPTIKNCLIEDNSAEGGGIYLSFSAPTIVDCEISNNIAPLTPGFPEWWATSGGGIYSSVSSPLIVNCIISDNTATADGGGVNCYSRGDPNNAPILRNCIIAGNTANIGGALYRCRGEITNCTIVGNSASNRGGGVYDCRGNITNCIIWGNGDDLYDSSATYSCIQDNDAGEGNIHVDPSFADPNNGDFHLKSQAGRYDPNSDSWIADDVTSPCIDAGDGMTPIGYEPFPNGGIINMGAYGGTSEASKSYFGEPPCETIVAGDVNGDCKVNYLDFLLMALHWLEEH